MKLTMYVVRWDYIDFGACSIAELPDQPMRSGESGHFMTLMYPQHPPLEAVCLKNEIEMQALEWKREHGIYVGNVRIVRITEEVVA